MLQCKKKAFEQKDDSGLTQGTNWKIKPSSLWLPVVQSWLTRYLNGGFATLNTKSNQFFHGVRSRSREQTPIHLLSTIAKFFFPPSTFWVALHTPFSLSVSPHHIH